MTYRIQAVVLVVGLVQQLLDLVRHEAARRMAPSGKPIRGLRPTCPPLNTGRRPRPSCDICTVHRKLLVR
jgi:hypothetical protein